MLGWLRKAFRPRIAKHPMSGFVFKSAHAFFEVQCKFGDTNIRKGVVCYGLVRGDITDDVTRFTGRANDHPAHRFFDVLLADPSGGRTQLVLHDQRKGLVLPGDLVAWMPIAYSPEGGWAGQFIAVCDPAFNDQGVQVQRYVS